MISLDKITTNGKALFLAYDQGIEHGPVDFNDENINPNYILEIATKGEYNAIIFQKGVAEKYYSDSEFQNKIPLIIKLNGKTNLVKDQDPYSPILCTVDEAIGLGASAVGYTVYVGSEFESEMTSDFTSIIKEAHEKELPVIGWMYPGGKSIEGKDNKELTAYCARLGLELGADIIKIKYPGDKNALKWAVESAGKTKVVISGGVKTQEGEFLVTATEIMQTGAIGMAVGRNIWQSENPFEITKKLKEIIFR